MKLSLTQTLLSIACASLLFTSCQKQKEENTKAADDNGNCTYAFAEDYNQVVDATNDYKAAFKAGAPEAEQKALLRTLKIQCGAFAEKYKEASCKAAYADSQEERTIVAKTLIDSNCQQAMSYGSGKPLPEKPFAGNEIVVGIDPIN